MESAQAPLKSTKSGKEYQYTLWTDMTIKPHTVSHERYGHFICIPNPTGGRKVWGFEEETGCELFRQDFKEHIL